MAFAVATAIAIVFACAAARAATTWTFEQGWRLVSLPVAMEGRNLCDYLPGLSVAKISGGGYENCLDGATATIETGKGYWVYFSEKTQATFPSPLRTGGTYKTALKRGWNIIGSPVGVTMPWNDEILVDGVAATMSPKTGRVIYRYDTNQKKYAPAESMEPWTGYAIYAVEDCELRFPASQSEGITQGGTAEVETLPGGERVVARQLIVAKAVGATDALFEREVARYGIAVLGKNSSAGLYQIQLPVDMDIETAAGTLKKMGVAAAAPHYIFGITEHIPSDPPYAPGADPAQSWAFRKIRAPGVWTAYQSGSAPMLAFVDTGVDGSHSDFAGRLVPGADFIGEGNGTQDGHGHGTHAAGLAAAAGDNGYGVAGVCWDCRVMPVKACDSQGDCPFFAVMNGITFAANAGADVINLSVQGKVEQGSDAWKIFQTVIDHAVGTGATVVAAAGNSASDASSFVPAGLDGVITVGATDEGDALTAFSNFGAELDIAAPGARVYSLEPNGIAGYRDGTSAAAALVSGAAGLIVGALPTVSNEEIAVFLRETADPATGAYPPPGRLNLEKLMSEVSPPNAAPQISAIYAIPDSTQPGGLIDISAQVYDPDGDALTYKWESSFGALTPGSAATAKWTAPFQRGEYAVKLTVSDGRGGNASATAYASVGLEGLFMIRMGGIPAFMRVGETFEFKAYGQFADGEIYPINIAWELASPHGVITPDGKFTALHEGEAMLTARAGEFRRDAAVRILAAGETPPPMTVSGFAAPAGGDVLLTGDYGYDRLVVGDVTGDGVNDVIVGGVDGILPFKVYRGAGDGSFSLISTFGPNGCNTNHMALADIDGDGDLDLGTACLSNGGFKIFKNNGAGSFSISQQLCSPGCNGTSIVFADMFRNMRMDILGSDAILTNRNRIFHYDEAQHALGNPGMFQSAGVEVGSQANTQRVDVAYFNRTSGGAEDHYLDFVEANFNTQNRIYLYNPATGTYDMSAQFGPTGSNTLIVAEVSDGGEICDGDWDVIVANNEADGGIRIFRGEGDGTVAGAFQALTTTPATKFYSLTFAETENNIMPEIVAGTIENKKARLFTSAADPQACAFSYKLETLDLPEYSMDVSFGDFTGNRNPDLAIAGGNYISNEIWINDTAGGNTAPGAPPTAGCSVIESGGEGVLRLSWEKGTDAEAGVIRNLLTYDLRLTEHNVAAPSAAQPDRWSGAAAARPGNYLRSRSLGGGNTYQIDIPLNSAFEVYYPPYGSYYFNVRTVDAANARSAWFAPGLPVKCDNFVPVITTAAVFNPPFILNNGVSSTHFTVFVQDYNGTADITTASLDLTNVNGDAALALTHEGGGAQEMKFGAGAIRSTPGLAPGTKTATAHIQDAEGDVPAGYPASVSLDVEQWPEMTVCGADWPLFNCDEQRRSTSGVDSLWFVPFEQKWSKPLAQATTAAPVVKDGVVMIGLSDGTLAAYAAADGAPEWTAAAGAGPVAAAGAVASSGGVDALYTVSGSKVYAHRVSDGSAFWAAPNESATASISLPPTAMLSPVAATYDLLFFVDVNGIVHAVNKSDGALRWKVKGTGSAAVAAPLAVGDGILFVGDTAGNIFAFDTMTGTQAASAALPGAPEIKSIIVASNNLIVATPQVIYSLTASGAAVWNRPNPNGNSFTGSAAWVESASTLYAADDGGWVYKINAAGTITESGQIPGGAAVNAPLVYVSGVVYAGAQDGKIYGIYTDGMGVTSSVAPCAGSGVTGGMAVADETLFAVCGGAASKTLFAYKKADGLGPQADTCPVVSDSTDGAGLGTLRDCITKANATPVTHGSITFAGALAGATIAIGPNPLPAITADGVSVDGQALGITIDGAGCSAANCHGFKITEADATIKNLTIVNFANNDCDDLQGSGPLTTRVYGCAAVAVDGKAFGQVAITGNTIGIKTSGDMAGNYYGIHVGGCPGAACAAMNVDIGGDAAQHRNVISGGLSRGVVLSEYAEGVSIKGNYIGTATDGRSCSSGGNSTSNLGGGIYMIRTMDNSIGVEPGGAAGESNVIACNGDVLLPDTKKGGIFLDRVISVGTHMAGNCVGLCLSAANRCEQTCGGNHGPGISFSDVYGAAGNKAELGYDGDDKYTNVISGNKLQGIYMYNAQHVNIRNARIGLPQKNTVTEDYTDRGNTNDGIMMTGASRFNTIVNSATYPVRLAYNDASGILVESAGTRYNKFSGALVYQNDNNVIFVPYAEPVEISSGANENVQRPVIGSILTSGANFNITVNAAAPICSGCEVALYQVTDSLLGITEDGTGYGEGPYLLGTATTDGTGAATFTNVAVAQGEFVTAILTDTNSNSSKFALNKEVQPEDCVNVTSAADSGNGTLRHCIEYANGNPGFAITFDAALSGQTITPLTQLPTVTANGTSIDGDINGDGTPDITISGASCGVCDGLVWQAGSGTIKGLKIIRFNGASKAGIRLETAAATNNTITGNYIGNTGASSTPNRYGVYLLTNANGNIIGPSNVISGNTDYGIYIYQTNSHTIKGNAIGSNAALTGAMANGRGIYIFNGSSNAIGGSGANEANLIAYNTNNGINTQLSGWDARFNKYSRNSIFSNGGAATAGILNGTADGVNQGIKPPIINSIVAAGANYDIGMTIQSPISSGCTVALPCVVEVFSVDNPPAVSPDTTAGEAFLFASAFNVTTCAAFPCNISFSIPQASVWGAATRLTATVTSANNNTSMFADNRSLNQPPEVSGCAFVPASGPPATAGVVLSCTVSDPDGLGDISTVTTTDTSGVFGAAGATIALAYNGVSGKYEKTALTVQGVAAAAYNFTITATDSASATDTDTETFTVTNVAPTVAGCAFAPASGPPATAGVVLSCTVADVNGLATVTSVTTTDTSGVFGAAGATITLTYNGVTGKYEKTALTVQGVAAAAYNFTITATDSGGLTGSSTATFTVTNVAPTVAGCAFAPASGPPATAGVVLSCTVADANGLATITSVTTTDTSGVFGAAGATITLTYNGVTGKYEKTALTVQGVAAAAYNFTITATDSGALTGSSTATFTVTNVAPTVAGCAFVPASGPPATAGVVLSCTVADANGLATITSVTTTDTSGVFGAAGATITLTYNGVSGKYEKTALTVQGIAAAAYNFTITATDSGGLTGSSTATFTVTNVAPTVAGCAFVPASGPPATAGVVLSCTVADVNGLATITSVATTDTSGVFGAAGATITLTYNGVTGKYEKTALTVQGVAPAAYNFTITATDSGGLTGSSTAAFTVTNVAPTVAGCAFVPASGPPATAGVVLSCTVADANGLATISSVTTTDTSGVFGAAGATITLTYNGVTGKYEKTALTVQSVAIGTYSFTVTATDASAATGSQAGVAFEVTSSPPTVAGCAFAPASGPPATAGVVLSCTVSDPNGLGDISTVTTTDTSGVFGAAGATIALTYNGVTGKYEKTALTVQGVSPSAYNFTITATDASAATGSSTATFTVTNVAPTVSGCAFAPANGPPATAGVVLSCTVADANGLGDISTVTTTDTSGVFGAAGATIALTYNGFTGKYEKTALTVQGISAAAYNFTVTATDAAALSDTDTATFTVTNAAPTVAGCAFAPASGPPATAGVVLSCTVADANGLATVASVTTTDTSGVFGAAGATIALAYNGVTGKYEKTALTVQSIAAAAYNFTVTATDTGGLTGSSAATFTVTNAAPTVSGCAFAPASGPPATAGVVLSCTVADPNGLATISTVTTTDTSGVFGAAGATIALAYNGVTGKYEKTALTVQGVLPAAYNFTVTATDTGGMTGSSAALFTATNVAPSVSACAFAPPNGAPGFTPVRLSCAVTDPNGHADVKSVSAPDPDGVFGAAPLTLTRVGATDVYESSALTVQSVAQLTYDFTATATDFSDATASQTNVQFQVTGLLFPDSPAITDADGANGAITVTLVAPTLNNAGLPLTNLAQHSVYVSATPGGPYAAAGSVVSTVPGATYQFVHNGPFTWYDTYCYVATAVDSDGGESVYSNEMCAVAQPPAYSPGKTCAQLPGDIYIAPDTPGYVNRPTGVSIGAPSPSGFNYVYIADNHNNRVSVFDEDCNFYETWGEYGSEDGNFKKPNAVLYQAGFVYVSDSIARIQKFDAATGTFVSKGSVVGPWKMAMLPSGSMLVATYYKKLSVFDPNSMTEDTGAAATVPDSNGVIYNPSNGLVYVSDKVNHVVMAYTTVGTPQPANNIGYGAGSGFGQLDTPAGLAVDSSGNIYVADSGNDRIQIFSPSNQLINTIGSNGAGPGQLRTPYDVTISSATGLVWVTDYLNQRFTGYAPPP